MKYCYKYIKHILEKSELNIDSTIRNSRTVQNDFNSVVKECLTTATKDKNHSVTQSNQEL